MAITQLQLSGIKLTLPFDGDGPVPMDRIEDNSR